MCVHITKTVSLLRHKIKTRPNVNKMRPPLQMKDTPKILSFHLEISMLKKLKSN